MAQLIKYGCTVFLEKFILQLIKNLHIYWNLRFIIMFIEAHQWASSHLHNIFLNICFSTVLPSLPMPCT